MTVIVITESQYGRLFLNEQGSADSFVDNYGMGLVDKYKGEPFGTTMRTYKKNQSEQISKFWKEHKHDIIDVAAIAVLFIPVAGPFISAGLELVNAGLYYAEGDEGMAAFAALLAVVPGGMAIRRSMQASKILKGVDKATQSVIAAQKAGKKVSKEALEKKNKE